MDKLLFAILFTILIIIGSKNFTLIKRYKQNKYYIDCYQNILHNKEHCYEDIVNYIKYEKTEEYKNKARIIQLYYELENDIDITNTFESLNIRYIFCKKGILDNSLVNLNADSFVFIILAMIKAYSKNNNKLVEDLSNKLKEIENFDKRLEYQLILAIEDALIGTKSAGCEFMKRVLDGDYTDYKYEKNMIGLYKRTASSILAFNNEDFDEYFRNDLHSYAKSLIGETMLKSLGIYETYKPIEEEEEKQEVVEEVEEPKNEEATEQIAQEETNKEENNQ